MHAERRTAPILVISLPEALARRRLMQAQLELPGMPPYRVIDAVDGKRLDQAKLNNIYDDAAARRRMGRSLTPGEIGCAASHLDVYRRMVADATGAAVILEDDALLGSQFLMVLDRLLATVDPDRPQAILLSHVVRYSAWGGRRVDKIHSLYRPYEAYGAHAYLITVAGARAMLAAFRRVAAVGDDWIQHMRAKIIDVHALVPYLVGTSVLSARSQIGERDASPAHHPLVGWVRKYVWGKLVFQLAVKPALRLRRQEQTW